MVTSTSETEISLSWTAPADDGGGALDGYNVYRCEEGQAACTPAYHDWVPLADGTSYSDDSVTQDTEYRYAVGSSRGSERSDWSNQVTVVAEAARAPSAPTGLSGQASSSKVVLAWTAPTDPGTTALTSYTLYRGDGDVCDTLTSSRTGIAASATSAEDTSVAAGSTYCYQLTATNSVGGEGSRSGSAVLKAVTVGAPTVLTVTSASGTSVSLGWTAPADDGGGALDGYNVYRCEEGQAACTPAYLDWVPLADGTSYSDDSVTQDTEYRYAVGSSRGSERSDLSNQVTVVAEAARAPSAPTGLSGQASSSKVVLAWTAPTDPGTTALTSYTLYRGDGDVCDTLTSSRTGIAASATSAEDTSVAAGSTYCYQLTATNSVGGEGSRSGSAVLKAVTVGAPTVLTVTSASGTSVSLGWTAPADDGGGALDGYNVYRCEEGQAACTPAYHDWVPLADGTSYSDDSVTQDTEYRYAVGSSRGSERSDWSNQVTVVAEAARAPSAPTGLSGQASSSKVVLAWTAPTDPGTTALTSYTLYRGDGDVCDTLTSSRTGIAASATSAEDTSVAAGSTYCYQLTATNSVGGEGSRSGSAVLKAVTVGAPTVLTVTSASGTSVSLGWTAPADDGGGALDGYNVYRCEEGQAACTPAYHDWVPLADGTSYSDDSVTQDTEYRYAVGSSRGSERSDLSNQVTVAAEQLTLVLNLDAIAGDGTVNIAEKAAGFEIGGDTGTEAGVGVTVGIGVETLITTSADDAGTATWTVSVPADAAYISGASVAVEVNASKTGYTAPAAITRSLAVDLAAPTAPGYSAPGSLKVGEAITSMSPSGGIDIAEYGAADLPPGLAIDDTSGVIGGTPEAAEAATATATVTVGDAAGNTATVDITFPAVAKGDQALTGFRYSPSSVTYGSGTVPSVTAPTGARTSLSYTATPAGVCGVDPTSGALTLVGAGVCEITATAAGSDDYNEAIATYPVTVQAAGALALNLGVIAGDGTVNIAEKGAGFEIGGDTGTEAGVGVTVGIGGETLTTTSADDAGTATWTVSVPADAAYISGASVAVEVNASKTGYTAPAAVTRSLAVDLTAPTAPGYSAPGSLKVGEAIGGINPLGGVDVDEYRAADLPPGLAIDDTSGVIGGTPDAAEANTAMATITVSDAAGNTATATIIFPAVDKGDQALTGFRYSPSSVTYGSGTVPSVTAPTGARTSLSYTATPAGVCGVDPTSGALTLVGAGVCEITATAAGSDDYNEAIATYPVTVQAAGALVLNLDAIAGDGTVNIAEKAVGFEIGGDTGTETGVGVTVGIGGETLTTTSADDAGTATWTVSVPADAAYISGASVAVEVNASKTGYTAPAAIRRSLAVDLAAPTAPGYSAPGSLKVGEAIGAINPLGGVDVDEYGATGLPPGLGIDPTSGVIGGTPDAAEANTATATITVSDAAGNTATATIIFPAVDKGDQALTGFQYSASSVSFGSTAPTVTVPTGAQTTLGYSAEPSTVCSVDDTNGALTLDGVGTCTITATAEASDNYNEASVTFDVTVQATGLLVLNVDDIAGDDTINIEEKASGFDISGNTGSEGGVSVTVTVGGTELTATSADADPATWTVNVPVDATYITGTSVDVTVSASKAGYTSPSDVTGTLTVDLAAPTAPTYSAPVSLKVGEAITALNPSGGIDIAEYSAAGLPSGLVIDAGGVIGGTPDKAGASTATATVTVRDAAGNTATATIIFPAVDKGDQALTGFQYSPSSVTYGSATVPSVTAPTGARTSLSYTASPADVCAVEPSTGALTLVGAGVCEITATAAGSDDYNEAIATYPVTVQAAGALVLNLDAIAGDGTVNIAEKAAGFEIGGDTGTEAGVGVTVGIGGETLTTTSADDAGTATWTVSVPADAAYISGTSMDVTVSASKTGFTAPNDVARTLAVDLAAPTAPTYSAPVSLKVGEAITSMSPSGGVDIDEYSATNLPSGLTLNTGTGVIGGTPDKAEANAATATVTVGDAAGNTATATIIFPAVDKGDQALTGFQYSPSSVTYGSATVPAVTAPTGVLTTLSYLATPDSECTVDPTSGALTLLGAGDCEITATAAGSDDYNEATVGYTVTVQAAGALVLTLDAIATDDIINIAEKAAGFEIGGDTGSEGGVSVTVTLGDTELTATSADADPAIWSVSVAPDASYITGAGVAVEVNASKTGYSAPSAITRSLAVDLTAPTAPTYSAPVSLKVGEAITSMSPSGGVDIDEYSAADLPSGLTLNTGTGVIGGTPEAADVATATATVTVRDAAGNTATATIIFPAVDKGDQALVGFEYSPSSVTYGSATVPAVTAPTGVLTTLSYLASPADVCAVEPSTGALTLVGAGVCEITATAAGSDDYNEAIATYPVTVQAAGALVLNLDAIAGDGTVNIAEKAAGFEIGGDTGTEAGVGVTVEIGGETLTTTSADDAGTATWTVSVPADAAYISGASVAVEVNASKTGYSAPAAITRSLAVDLTAPTAPTYSAPVSLKVGEAITSMSPSGGVDIDEYSATDLPSGLTLNTGTGVIGGTPEAADVATATATVTVRDAAGNTATATIIFPAVDKGDQALTGFQYSASSVSFGSTAPTVTVPTGAQTTLGYSAEPSTVCSVDDTSGALTLDGVGTCTITATAEASDNYNEASVTFDVTVQATGLLVLNVDDIAGDDTINIEEKASGFDISGNTGSEGGVSVTVTVGGTELTATSADADPATWTVSVPADAAYITGTSVDVTVSASKAGYTSPSDVTGTLTVDLTAPTAPTYSAPVSLKVGEAITALNPSGGIDIAEYSAAGLPSGLVIDAGGVIGGTPDKAGASTATATVTVRDAAGNTATATIIFPAVDKGDQALVGFEYSPSSVTYGSATVPAVTAPTGVLTTLSYLARPTDVCAVDPTSGALTLLGAGDCEITATAAGSDDYNEATVGYTVTVQAAGALVLNLGVIAGDGTVNIAEKAAGFEIGGDTGTEAGVGVTVGIGGETLTTTSADDAGTATWTVSVPADAAYISGASVAVEVNASKTGYSAPAAITRSLAVDLTAPTAPTYSAPVSLKVGEAITSMSPSGGVDIDEYSATDLPSGLTLNTGTGVIGGTPEAADVATATATVTVRDAAGNTATATIIFPAVDKGDQALVGFEYSPSSVTYGSGTVPAVTAPTGVLTTLSYLARPTDVCTVDPTSGALTLLGAGDCEITATAAGSDDYNEATVGYTVTVQAAGALVLTLDAIATDDIINIAEKAAGFEIGGDTGTEAGVGVTVGIGGETLTTTSADDAGTATWTVSVPADAAYISGTSMDVTVSASKTGFTAPNDVARTLAVDLAAPTAPTYSAPVSLKVGEAITSMSPSGGVDIDEYSATNLPSGLTLNTGTGVIGGTPDKAEANAATATVTVGDAAGNTATATIIFPAVDKGDQALTGFQYSPSSVTYGSATVPAVTAPTGVFTTLSYLATPDSECTVDPTSGALTLLGAGDCEITATAAGSDDYNEATVGYTVTVQAAGALVLTLDAIATDDIINIAEKAAGFEIGGDTGSEGGVSVTVTLGDTELTATSADADPAIWSVSVAPDASYITGAGVAVEVNASKTGYSAPSAITRSLAVDLTAPTAPTYSAPVSLKVGEAITSMSPSGGVDIDEYSAADLPPGLAIDDTSGVIGGTPDKAEANTATVTITVSDAAGNTATATIIFPAVDKGDQALVGFEYSPSSVTYGSGTVPAVTAPTGVLTTLSYLARPTDVCTVDPTSGALTLLGAGDCEITATAAGSDDYNEATVGYTVTVQAAGALVLNLGVIAGDGTVNIAEKAAGFEIGGDTGTEAGVGVTVGIGGETLTTTSADDAGTATWTVSVPADAAYISGASVAVEVSASKTGYTAPAAITRSLAVDLAAPTAPGYSAPGSLKVGEAITSMSPSGGIDIAEYGAADLPPGLAIDDTSGVIGGTPEAAEAATATATVTVGDAAGNTATVDITFPAVAKGDQALTGFRYSPSSVTYGSGTVPSVTAPTGPRTSLSYTATPAGVCGVEPSTGALTLLGAGVCEITATAEGSDDYNEATVGYTVTVRAAVAPGAPTGLAAQASETKALLSWAAPGSTGTSALTGYTLYRGDGGACDNLGALPLGIAADATSAEDATVAAGSTYCYAVAASSSVGEGSRSSGAAVAAKLPGAPTGLTVTSASGTSVSLGWTAPADDGGGALDGYNVYRCEEGQAACTPAYHDWVPLADGTSYSDDSVTGDAEYRYAVGASRLDGRSDWSNEVAAVAQVPATPGAPTGLAAQASETKALLSWAAPGSTGTSALTGYTLYRGDGGACDNLGALPLGIAADATSAEDATVAAGSTYCYAVAASSSVGEGSRSSGAAVAAKLPGAPTGLTVTSASGTSVSLGWTAPADDGGGALDGYNVYRCEEGQAACTPAYHDWVPLADGTSYSDDSVTGDAEYRYAVGASRLDGRSDWSNEVAAVAQVPATPGAPTGLAAQASETKALLSWAAPGSTGTSALTGYTLYRGDGGACDNLGALPLGIAADATSAEDATVAAGSTYCYAVAASSSVGEGSRSSGAAVAAKLPGAPTGLTVTSASGTSVSLGWTAPADDGGGALDGYNVYRCEEGQAACTPAYHDWVPLADGTSYSDDSVTGDAEYRYAVGASRLDGRSDWSNEVAAVAQVPATPGAPTGLAAQASETKALLSWAAPGSTGTSALTGYTLYRGDGGACDNLGALPLGIAADATSAEDATVAAGSTYCYAVAASSSVGEGSRSSGAAVAAKLPGAPTGLTVTSASGTSVSLGWTAPADDGGGALDGYNVYRCEEGQAACTPAYHDWVPLADGTSYSDDSVTGDAEYRYAVGAARLDGRSDWSNEVAAVAQVPATPGAPTGLAAQASETKALLSWAAPGSTGTSALTGYTLYRGDGGACDNLGALPLGIAADATSAEDATVAAGSTYCYAVAASSSVGEGSRSSGAAVAAKLPGAPTGLTVTSASGTSVSLGWTAPADDGGGALDGYNVYRCEEGQAACTPAYHDWVPLADGTSYSDDSVTGDAEYRYAVGASRLDGRSDWSNEVAAVAQVPATPGAPTGLAAQASETKALLSWAAPGSTGTSALTGYTLYRGDGGACDNLGALPLGIAADATSAEDATVAAGSTYCYAVAASSSVGEGSRSSGAAVAAKLPGAPTGLTVTSASGTSVSLGWTAPADDGGGALDGYNVYRCEEGQAACTPAYHDWVPLADGTSYSDDSVTGDAEYRYAVGASRLDGRSDWSNEVAAVAQVPATPGAPTGLAAQASETKALLSWAAPGSTGTSALTGYTLYRGDGGACDNLGALPLGIAADATSAEDATVAAGSTYCYAVAASSSVGEGSRSSGAAVAAKLPGAPTGLTVTSASGTSVSLGWTAPADDGGGALDGYNVYRCEEGQAACTPAYHDWVPLADGTSYSDDSVTGDAEYRYAVGAARLDGRSDWSNEVAAVAQVPATPGAPTGLAAQASETKALLSWAAPGSTGTSALTGYTLYRGDGGACDNLGALPLGIAADATSAEDATVAAGSTYCYAVAASSSVGEGSRSSGAAVAAKLPGAPTGLTVTSASGTSVSLGWTAPADDGGGALDGYNVYRCEEGQAACTPAYHDWVPLADGTSYSDDSVTGDAEYRYAVGASRLDGRSDWSNEVAAVAQVPATPGAPTGLAAQASETKALLSWAAPGSTGTSALTGYTLYRGDGGACDNLGALPLGIAADATSAEDATVAAGSTYCYAVAASSSVGEGSRSSGAAVAAKLPGAPTGLTVTSASGTSVSLGWTAPADDGGGALDGYNVYRCEEGQAACTPAYHDWVPLADGTSYSDDSVTGDAEYRYAVGAARLDGRSDWSNEVAAVAQVPATPGAPTGLAAQASETKALLTWAAPGSTGTSALTGYTLYRGDGGACDNLGALPLGIAADATSAEDATVAAGSTYCYAVAASSSVGEGSRSSGAAVAAKLPGAPTGLTVTSASGTSVSLGWTAPADDGGGALDGYNVYRCEEGQAACTPAYLDWVPLADGTSYSDDSVTGDAGYRYAVGASRLGAPSAWSEQVVAVAEAAVAPGTPTGLAARANGERAVLSWAAPGDGGNSALTGYTLYRGAGDGCGNLTSLRAGIGAGERSAEDTGVTEGGTYCYRLTASNALAGEGAGSNTAVVVVAGPSAPTGLAVTLKSASAIGLAWTAPADDVGGALDGYNVLRCLGSGCDLEWLAWVADATGYTDGAVEEGAEYTYAVASSRLGWESPWSNQVTVTLVDEEAVGSRLRRLGDEILSRQAFAIVDDTAFKIDQRLDSMSHGRPSQSTANSNGHGILPKWLSAFSGAMETGGIDTRQLLNNSSFVLPLGTSASGLADSMSIWGSGSYLDLSGGAGKLDWSGNLLGVQIGADVRLRPEFLAGIAMSWSKGSFDYQEVDVGGRYSSEITSLHPYVGWTSEHGVRLWASGGFGRGQIEIIDEDVDRQVGDTRLQTLSGGASTRLFSWGGENDSAATSVRVKGEVAKVRVDVESEGLPGTSSLDSSRGRVAVEGSRNRELTGGRSASSSLEIGWRQDQGDARAGWALEAAMDLQYADARRGLMIDGRGRYAASSDENFSEWGANLSIRLDPGPAGQGVSFSLVPSYGVGTSGVNQMWDQGLDRISLGRSAARARVEAELGYGILRAGSLFTPYGAIAHNGSTQVYRLGGKFDIRPGLDLKVEGERRVGMEGTDYGIRLTGKWQPGAATPSESGVNQDLAGEAESDEAEVREDDEAEDSIVEEIVVTGSRLRSLADALEEKRLADSILDAVAAENLGKLPEISIAEALARLPGVVANRDRGQATEISIRGLGSNLSHTLLNGREVATGGYTRNVRYETYPGELLGGAAIFKSTKASRVEGGIGGVVDLRTVRPLDTQQRRLAANIAASYFEHGDKIQDAEPLGYIASFAYLDQFLEGSLGVALGYSRREQPIATARTNIFNTTDSFVDIDGDGTVAEGYSGDLITWGYEALFRGGDDDRDGVVAALQWAPSENVDLIADLFYSGIDFVEEQRGFRIEDVPFGNAFSDVAVEGNLVTSATVTQESYLGMKVRTVNESWTSFDDTYAGGLSLEWESGPFSVLADVAYSRAEQKNAFISVHTEVHDISGDSPVVVTAGLSSRFGAEDRGVGVFEFGEDLADPSTNLPAFVRAPTWDRVADEIVSYGVDATAATGTSFFRSLSAGLRYSDRRQGLVARSASSDIEWSDRRPVPDELLGAPLKGFGSFSDLPPVLSFDRDGVIEQMFGGLIPEQTNADMLESNVVEEDIFAGYVEAEFEGKFFGLRFDGSIGVRTVFTRVESSSTLLENSPQTGFVEQLTPFTVSNEFTDILPSLNLAFPLSERQTLRIALAKAIARAPLHELNAGVGVYNFGFPEAYGGNPLLEPFRANQLDISYENYFGEGAAFTVNAFLKDLDTYITRRLETDVHLPTDERGIFVRSVNGRGGRILGVEFSASYPLKFLPSPLDGLGIWSNYTYIESKIKINPVYVIGDFPLPGLAPHTFNLGVWYWKRGFELHLGYRYRDAYATWLADVPGQVLFSDTEKRVLDFQVGYTFQAGSALEGLKVALQGYNLANEPFRSHYANEARGRFEEYGRRFWLSLSYEF